MSLQSTISSSISKSPRAMVLSSDNFLTIRHHHPLAFPTLLQLGFSDRTALAHPSSPRPVFCVDPPAFPKLLLGFSDRTALAHPSSSRPSVVGPRAFPTLLLGCGDPSAVGHSSSSRPFFFVGPRAFSRLLVGFWARSALGGGRRRSSRGTSVRGAMAGDGEGGRKVLITFDVDGTLMQSIGEDANLMHKNAFSYAFHEVFGVDGNIDVLTHHGSTDPMILVSTLEYYGIPGETATAKLPELKSKMVEYSKNNSAQVKDGLELLPGVAALLEDLSKRKTVVVALVTGNLEDIGWLKMDALGIRPFFSTPNFGGFGSDHSDRGELVKIAASRADKFFPGGFSKRVHVGDTPNDIRAAENHGALAIGVCTGIFSRNDLLAASGSGKAVILDDLKNRGVFLRSCGLE